MTLFAHEPRPKSIDARAVQALIVYECTHAFSAVSHFFTTHRIEHSDSGALIADGQMLGARDHHALLKVLTGMTASAASGFLPPTILASSASQLVWYIPAQVRPMWFRIAEVTLCYQVPWPTLILRAEPGQLCLAAVRARTRPRERTPLFHAPLMNIGSNTVLCAGGAQLPEGVSLPERAAYEDVVFNTNFSHINHRRTLRINGSPEIGNTEHLHFWRGLHQENATRFPHSALVPLRRTLSQWLDAERE